MRGWRALRGVNIGRLGLGGLLTALAVSACAGPPSAPTTSLVPPAVLASSLTVSAPKHSSLSITDTLQLSATAILSDGTAEDVTAKAAWLSSDVHVVTVSTNGLVKAQGAGTATITATFQGVSTTDTEVVLVPQPLSFSEARCFSGRPDKSHSLLAL